MEIPAQTAAEPTTWQDWGIAVLSGTVGSVLALLGLVAVYLLTQRSERRRASEIRRSESVADLLVAAEALAREVPDASDEEFDTRAEACERYGYALIRFSAREIREHSDVARWAMAWSIFFTLQGATLRDGTRREREDAERQAVKRAAQLNASLLQWLENPGYAKFPTAPKKQAEPTT